MKKEFNYNILFVKVIMSILVVGIHVYTVASELDWFEFVVFQGLARLAVPCFFTYSAYFLYKKKVSDEMRLLKYVQRMIKLMISWSIVTLPYILYRIIYIPFRDEGYSIYQIIGQNLLSPRANGFWYIYACIICACLIYLFRKHTKKLIIFSILAQFVCIVFSSYIGILPRMIIEEYDVFSKNLFYINNSFFVGMIYFLLGEYIAKRETKDLFLYQFREYGLIISILLFLLEINLVWNYHIYGATDCYFMLVPTTYFVVLNSIEGKLKKFPFSRFLNATTTVVYIMQFSVIFFIQGILKRITGEVTLNRLEILILVILTCYALTLILMILEKQKKCKFIKWMH